MENKSNQVMGVGVIVIRDGKILLGKRKGAHGSETWALPGGRMDTYEKSPGIFLLERPEEAAIRELSEETGLKAISAVVRAQTSYFFEELDQEHISTYVQVSVPVGEPELMEPDKCYEWGWFYWNHLPQPIFPLLANIINNGFIPEGIVCTA